MGCGEVDVKDKFIREGNLKWCVHGKIHIRMKPTAVKITKRIIEVSSHGGVRLWNG